MSRYYQGIGGSAGQTVHRPRLPSPGNDTIAAIATEAAQVIHDLGNQIQCASSVINVLRKRLHKGDVAGWRPLANSLTMTIRSAGEMARRLCTADTALDEQRCTVDVEMLLPSLAPALQVVVGDAIQLHCFVNVQGYRIDCDVHALEASIVNLVMNSRDALPDGGEVLVSANLVLSDVSSAGDGDIAAYICLGIYDNGVGMSDALRATACDPFVSTKAAGRTRGLGLTSVKGFTEGHGGWLDIESKSGRGTAVLLYLPADRGD